MRILSGIIISVFILIGCSNDSAINEVNLDKALEIAEVVVVDKMINKNKNLSLDAVNSIAEIIQDEGKEYIDIVKYGYFYDYSYITVEEAFNNYFGEPRWNYFLSNTNEHIVEFRGFCIYYDVEVETLVQFVLSDVEFVVEYLGFNSVPQAMIMWDALLQSVYSLDVNTLENSVKYYSETELVVSDYPEEEPYIFDELERESFWYQYINLVPEYPIGVLFDSQLNIENLNYYDTSNKVYISGYHMELNEQGRMPFFEIQLSRTMIPDIYAIEFFYYDNVKLVDEVEQRYMLYDFFYFD